ncbi:putative repeat protein (TIGR01451 family) [Lysobacter enzymogenes]|uniref:OmpA family protein n=1 Tax=Lysobacter enzymogenes TaxID=69 RepID=UPI003397125D
MPKLRYLAPLLFIATTHAQTPSASNTARVRIAQGANNIGELCLAANGSAGFDAATGTCSAVDTDPVGSAAAAVEVRKSAMPTAGSQVRAGEQIAYRLEAVVTGAALAAPLVLTDTPAAGLAPASIPQGCERSGVALVCAVPAGSAPGTYAFEYRATVAADVGGEVSNSVVASGGGATPPQCPQCRVVHTVVADAQLKISKSAAPRKVKVGDLVRYSLTVENVGRGDVRAATLVDTPPPGFSLVPGSLEVSDRDGAGRLATRQPIVIGDIDVAAGASARVQYLLRVGAGVRPGTHVNRVRAEDGGAVVSNEASASVEAVADPLLDESLVFGTVFDDRDRDGWQDPAGLSGLKARGGFAADAYIAGSTTLTRDGVARALADASAPLLHGIELGDLSARRSDADPQSAHRIVLSQLLRRAEFTDDFVLTSKEGFRVVMDAAGATRVESPEGDAARGLSAAAPRVERRIGQVADGYRVDYLISNAGVAERGLPGVRVAAVEGLLVETDAFGRYHLLGIDGGRWERGRQFTLKVDPATLPRGAEFTTDNPRLRRITPGLPTRYDFGVAMPPGVQAQRRDEELVLGEFVFAAGSAELDPRYAPLIAHVAEWARDHADGRVAMSAQAVDRGLAYRRAVAVREAVLAQLATVAPQARAPRIELRADAERVESTLLTVGDAVVLGTVLFDTDRSAIKPEFAGLLDRIARDIAAMSDPGEYRIAVTGHADRRASDDYNQRLGMRRARAVFDALAARLEPQVRQRLRVDIDNDSDAGAKQE